MANVGDLNVRINVDTAGLNTGIQQAQTRMQQLSERLQSLGTSMMSAGKNMTLGITVPLLAAGGASIKLASDMAENLNKVNVVFKGNASEIINWSDTTLKSFGIANVTALDMVSLFGDMATSQGLVTSEAAKMSVSLVGLAGDLASLKNINIEVAQTALKGIFTGETESLKGLGIVMTEANVKAFALANGFKANMNEMTQAEKTTLRYAFVLNSTKNSQGDFSRTSEGAANQMRIFRETLKELGVTLGTTILPIFTNAITKLNELLNWFKELSPGTKKWIMILAGVVAVIGPIITILGGLIWVLGALFTPIGLVVAGITALTATGYWMWKNWDKIKNALSQIFGEIFYSIQDYMSKIKIVVLFVITTLVNAFSQFINFISLVINKISKVGAALGILKSDSNFLTNGLNGLNASVKNVLTSLDKQTSLQFFNKEINKTAHEAVMTDLRLEDLNLRLKELNKPSSVGINDTTTSLKNLTTQITPTAANVSDLKSEQSNLAKETDTAAKAIENEKRKLQEQIDVLQKSKDAIIKYYDKLGASILTALSRRYKEQEQMEEKSLNYRINQATFETNNIIKLYEKMASAKMKAIDESSNTEINSIRAKIDNINELTDKENRDLEQSDYEKRLSEKSSQLTSAKNEEDKNKILSDMSDMKLANDRKLLLQSRRDEIESLRTSIDTIKSKAELDKQAISDKLTSDTKYYELAKQTQDYYFGKEKEDLATKYKDLNEEEAIQAEAREFALTTNNNKLIKLLDDYNPSWRDAGKSFGEKLLEGLQSVTGKIETEISKIMSKINNTSSMKSSISTPVIPVLPKSTSVSIPNINNSSKSSNTTFNITETSNAQNTAKEVVKILRLQGVRA